jgi:RNA polymerase sigma-70 factor (ECF subfamily)
MAFDAWGGPIHTYCARRLPDGEAADATQEVFVAAWRARDQFDPERGVLAQWLFGIARNTCVAFHRRRARVPEPMADVPVDTGGRAEDDDLSDRLLVLGALDQLPERQRRVLRASFMEGWTNAEVADRLGLPLGTVKSDIRRGLTTIREHLEVVG